MTIGKQVISFVGGIVLMSLFAFMLLQNAETRWIDDSVRNGYTDAWKLQFLIYARLAMFPLFGAGLILLSFDARKLSSVFLWLALVATVMSGLSMVLVGMR